MNYLKKDTEELEGSRDKKNQVIEYVDFSFSKTQILFDDDLGFYSKP